MNGIETQAAAETTQERRAPRVTVIVPHYNDLRGLDLCLQALGRQTFPAEAFEIVVSDNASPVGAEAVARTIAGRARLIVTTEKGAGPARNGGVAEARGEILAFTDSDCQPEPEWLERGVEALSRADFVGGQMKVLVDDPDTVTATEAFELVFAFDNETYVFQKGFTVTANLFCRRELFERVGKFGVGLSEDVDWCHRATRAGLKIGYEPAAIVGHPARRTWAELEKKWRRTNREAYLLHSSSPQGFLKYVARSVATPLSAFAHTPRVLLSDRLRSNRQRIQALQTLYRLRFWRFANSMALVVTKGGE